jgi:lysophospholipase L1-like esterase
MIFLIIASLFATALPASARAAAVSDFSDVHTADWFYGAVRFVTENGMFNGTDASAFSPNGTMTRGMFVTVLGRYGGAPSVSAGYKMGRLIRSDVNMRSAPSVENTGILLCLPNATIVEVIERVPDQSDPAYTWYYVRYSGILGYIRSDLVALTDSGFTDVPETAYYYSYVQWAFSNGIAGAAGENSFSPERAITREEICSMLANYASFKNYQLRPAVAAQSFTDMAAVSSGYAAVSKLQQAGVINGYTDGSFRPAGNATRAEVSTMLMRFVEALGYKKTVEASVDAAGNHIFGTELPQKAAVTADYFSDACFIGHSLVNGMRAYFDLSNADFFAKNGATAKYFQSYADLDLTTTHLDDKGYTVPDKGSLEDALSAKNYGKVYIMLGVNEISASAASGQSFYTSMSGIVDLVKRTRPGAKIYLFSLTPVTQACSESDKSINRDSILAFNTVVKQLCKDKSVCYLNVFDLLCNADGFMDKSACLSDGIHLLAPAYASIKSYLMTHTA